MSIDTKQTADIAIVGIGCRFPGADNPEKFWEILRDGVDCVTEFSADQLKTTNIPPSLLKHPALVNKGMVLENYDAMDAAFFGLSPRDAEIMDPQHRVFLECAWEALEDAGYNAEQYNGLTGVYAGVDCSSYLVNIYRNPEVLQSAGMFTIALHNDKDSLTTRVAYKLNLKGPAVTVQTACSTSLTAVIHACQSLLNYQCDMALAGGVSISLPQDVGYFFNEREPFSRDGHTRAFDADATGSIAGSGAGVVVLKRLDDALADRDHIEAIIRGFGINNDGAEKVGFTAPSIQGQAEAISMAQTMAGVSADDISYIEAHGTGTVMGDPIEVGALTQVFRRTSNRKNYCGLGSVKTNIGHCNSAAGVAGLIKTVLALKHRMLPPSLHFVRPNPNIDFDNSPFYVVDALRPWEPGDRPRLAGVSSFGIGGTNGHLVLQEAPDAPLPSPSRSYQLITLSARSAAALDSMCSRLQQHLQQHPDLSLPDLAYTLQTGRKRFSHRKIYVLPSDAATAGQPHLLDNNLQATTETDDTQRKQVVFLFPGQGAQYVNMGKGLYDHEPLFRQIVDECCHILQPLIGADLRTLMYNTHADAAEQLKQTAIAQPAIFVTSYATAKLWMSWGIKPDIMIGHSIGELAAACVAEVFTMPEALRLVAARGKLMQSMPPGAMTVIHLPLTEVQPLLDASVSVAAINTPGSCVVSGTFNAIDEIEQQLKNASIAYQRLVTSHAFHSTMMDPIISAFVKECDSIFLNPPKIPFVSNVAGTLITSEAATDPAYWGRQIRSTVQFSASISTLLKHSARIYIETGPGQSLCTLLYEHRSKREGEVAFPSLPHPKDKQADLKVMTKTLGELWMAGINIDWSSYYGPEIRSKLALPSYPFEHERYWIDPAVPVNDAMLQRKKDLRDWLYIPAWSLCHFDNTQAPVPKLNTREKTNGNDEKHNGNGNSAPNGKTPLPEAAAKKQEIWSTGNWLILDDGSWVGETLQATRQSYNGKLWRVIRGNEFKQIDDTTFMVNPAERESYANLWRKMQQVQFAPDRILHMWHLMPGENVDNSSAAQPFYELLYLAQEMLQHISDHAVQLKIIACNMHSLHETEVVDASLSLLKGACKVLSQEFPMITCQEIDMEPPVNKELQQMFLQNLFQELLLNTNDEQVVYRRGNRWIRSFRPAGPVPPLSNSILKKHGVYIITGGLGGVGLVLAKYLGKRYKAKLVLTGRSYFPPAEDWENWVTQHETNNPISDKIRQLRKLRQVGAEIMVETADVSSFDDLLVLKKHVDERFGEVNGIIHSAGVAGGGIIPVKKETQAANVLNPKLKGTVHLDAVFGGQRLDFFLLCSSLSAVMGGVGQIDYCAANNFLDGYAHQKNKRIGTRYISVNWDTWGEVGMAVNTEVPLELRQGQQEALRKGIRNAEGAELLERILALNAPQVLVSTSDLLHRINAMVSQQTLVQLSSKTPQAAKPR